MNGGAAQLVAQAKINLSLCVLARERSGYHQIETLFARLELGDIVTVRIAGDSFVLDCGGPALPPKGLGPMEGNLAYRAAVEYTRQAGWPRGAAIEIDKRIPVGAGLGGGSADAGAVLRALDSLAPRPLGEAALLEIAGTLGADVPFLTSSAPLALAWGRGERMLLLPPLPQRSVVIAAPPFPVATADAYGWLAAARDPGAPSAPAAFEMEQLRSWAGVTGMALNDFESVVFARHAELVRARECLAAAGARIARMSGSGSALFAVFDAPPDVERVLGPQLAAAGVDASWAVLTDRTAARVVEPSGME